MIRTACAGIFAIVGGVAALCWPADAFAQTPAPVCGRGASVDTMDLGIPDAGGVTRQERLDSRDDEKAFRFIVTEPSALYVYVGDQWYDLDLAVYSIELNRSIACWSTTGAKARSERSERRVLQLVRPDEQIVAGVQPGVYTLLAGAEHDSVVAGFDPTKAFTIRVAATPLICGLAPANVPHPRAAEDPAYQGVSMRADDALYQIAMNYEPLLPTPFTLMTFNVTASPPYNDLFDFQWFVNGRPVPGATDLTFQAPAADIAAAGGRGSVSVSARGARVYPDPDQPHTPLDGGTLTVECPVIVR